MIVHESSIDREERASRYFRVVDAEPVVEYVRRGRRVEDDRPVMLQVETVRINWLNGRLAGVRLDGHRIKADGKPGRQEGYRNYGSRILRDPLAFDNPPPQWLVDLVREAAEPTMDEYRAFEEAVR